MRLSALFLLTAMLVVLYGCSNRSERGDDGSGSTATRTANAPADVSPSDSGTSTSPSAGRAKPSTVQDGQMKQVSLANAQTEQASVTVTERKIIRSADLRLESNEPAEGQRRISSVAEAHGGFVVTSESKQRDAPEQLRPEMIVTITVRVPAAQFDAVIQEIRSTGSRVVQEKVTGQDVTEEYIDLEARIRAKKALEAQFMEIMKQARTVQDALEVQTQISEVRSEIERLEGRRRFLENQSSLSTIAVTLQPPTRIASSTGFFYSVKRAFNEGLDVAAAITLFFVQFIVALLPIIIFLFVPIFLIVRYLIRRARRQQPVRPIPEPPPTATTVQ